MADRLVQLQDKDGNNIFPVTSADSPIITVTNTDPGTGSALPANNFVAVYGGSTGAIETSDIKNNAVTAAKIDFSTVGMNYTLSEQTTPFTWVDGKTIYKKTVNFGALPNNTTKRVQHGISNIDRVVKVEQSITNAPSGAFHGFIFISSGNATNTQFNFWGTDTEICVTTTSDRSAQTAYITLYYTKQ